LIAAILVSVAGAVATAVASTAETTTLCGTFTGPHWTDRMSPYARRGHPESGTRYRLFWYRETGGSGPRCAWAKAWVTKIIYKHPARLYPSTPSADFLPPPVKTWLCAGSSGERFRMTGKYAAVGDCYPVPNVVNGFRWHPDDTRDRLNGN
jgi:hypothetical protein